MSKLERWIWVLKYGKWSLEDCLLPIHLEKDQRIAYKSSFFVHLLLLAFDTTQQPTSQRLFKSPEQKTIILLNHHYDLLIEATCATLSNIGLEDYCTSQRWDCICLSSCMINFSICRSSYSSSTSSSHLLFSSCRACSQDLQGDVAGNRLCFFRLSWVHISELLKDPKILPRHMGVLWQGTFLPHSDLLQARRRCYCCHVYLSLAPDSAQPDPGYFRQYAQIYFLGIWFCWSEVDTVICSNCIWTAGNMME